MRTKHRKGAEIAKIEIETKWDRCRRLGAQAAELLRSIDAYRKALSIVEEDVHRLIGAAPKSTHLLKLPGRIEQVRFALNGCDAATLALELDRAREEVWREMEERERGQ
jgi:hypothetical protein